MCASDGGAHVWLIQRTLRSSGNNIVLGAWVDRLVLCEKLTESGNTSNITQLLIWRRLLNIKIKTIEIDCHACGIIVVSTIQRTNTRPAGVVRSISTPKEVGQVNTISSTVQVVVTSGSTKREEDLLVGVLLTVVQILLKRWTLLIQKVVGRVVDTIVTRSRVVSIPTLISESLCHQSVRLRWEDIDESNRNNIDVRLVTIVCQIRLTRTGTPVHSQIPLR